MTASRVVAEADTADDAIAAGGTALPAAVVAMERSDTSPLDAGRRVVDVLATRFE